MLFDEAIDMENKGKEISALILGVGRLGTEMLKALTWYCQMDNYQFKVNAFDIEESTKDRITPANILLINSNTLSIPLTYLFANFKMIWIIAKNSTAYMTMHICPTGL